MTDDELLEARADIFGKIFVLVQHLTRHTDAALAPLGLTTQQWLLLAVLTRGFAGRSPTLTEAAARYGSSRQNVKQIALGLETRGFVRLVPDPDDGRATLLELTDRVAVFDEPATRTRGLALLADATAGLSPDETLVLRDLVRRWLAGVSGRDESAASTAS
jgi:DNA-binding MarR family transcriptional regulator